MRAKIMFVFTKSDTLFPKLANIEPYELYFACGCKCIEIDKESVNVDATLELCKLHENKIKMKQMFRWPSVQIVLDSWVKK